VDGKFSRLEKSKAFLVFGMSESATSASGEFERQTERPPFTLEDVKRVIPEACWKRSSLRSISYFLRDIGIIFCLYGLCYVLRDRFEEHPYILYPLFWFAQVSISSPFFLLLFIPSLFFFFFFGRTGNHVLGFVCDWARLWAWV
jgi:hypothetical protein